MNKLVCATLAAILGGCTPSCATTHNPAPVTVEQQKRQDLEDIAKSTHCIRSIHHYTNTDGKTKDVKGYGTAFVYMSEDGRSQLITNQHVIDEPDAMIDIDLKNGIFDIYIKSGEEHFLVDDRYDTFADDDIPLNVLNEDESIDIAILGAESELFSPEYRLGNVITPQFGDRIYLVGYPDARDLIVDEGVIANPYGETKGGVAHYLDTDGTFGNSGSPYFIERDGNLYLSGIMEAIARSPKGENLFGVGIPIERFVDMMRKSYHE